MPIILHRILPRLLVTEDGGGQEGGRKAGGEKEDGGEEGQFADAWGRVVIVQGVTLGMASGEIDYVVCLVPREGCGFEYGEDGVEGKSATWRSVGGHAQPQGAARAEALRRGRPVLVLALIEVSQDVCLCVLCVCAPSVLPPSLSTLPPSLSTLSPLRDTPLYPLSSS